MLLIRNILLLSGCYTSTTAFTTPLSARRTTILHNNYLDSIGADGENRNNADAATPPPPAARVEEPPSIDLDGQIVDRQSNLAFGRSRSVNEDPRPFDMESRLVADIVLSIVCCLHI